MRLTHLTCWGRSPATRVSDLLMPKSASSKMSADVTINDMAELQELNAVDRTVVDELDELIDWLWSEGIAEAKARLSVLTSEDYPAAVDLLGQIAAYKVVEQRLSYIRNRITAYPSETKWVRIEGEEETGR